MLNLYQGPIQFSNRLFSGFDALARHRFLSILLVACLSFGGCCLWALFRGIPIPYVQDEFNYLLEGDTFAHGHITNPMHPMRYYFEAVDILQQPTYMSKYQPGQGIFLAIGQVLFGHLIYGVWLSSALMCAAISWMLYAWVSPRWALMGGLVSVLQFGIFTYWNQSYWGGAVAGIGGALVFGALPRIFRTQRIRDALWLGLGCAVLANTRPFEGFLIAIPVGCLVLPWKIRWKKLVLVKFLKRIILPLAGILFITLLGIGAYNKTVTGYVSVSPYLFYDLTHYEGPSFSLQPIASRMKFNHRAIDILQDYYDGLCYNYKKAWKKGFVNNLKNDIIKEASFFFGYPLAVPSWIILPLFFIYRRTAGRYWGAFLVLLSTYGGLPWHVKPHYFSSLTCLAVLLITIGLRGLAGLKLLNIRVGLVFVILLFAIQLVFNVFLTPIMPVVKSLARSTQNSPINLPSSFTREELKDILIKSGGKYLVIVKYSPGHNFYLEWVYNDADIDHAPIVWARDMGAGHNKGLLEYFKDRQALFINVYWDMHGFPRFDARQ